MGIEQFLGVSYKLAESENFDEFMKELEVGIITRKLGNSVSSVITLTEKDGVYTLSTASTFKNISISFKIGEEFDEETIDGRRVKSTVTIDGNKLIQVQKGASNTTEIVREFSENTMVATMKVNSVVCTRKYNRQ